MAPRRSRFARTSTRPAAGGRSWTSTPPKPTADTRSAELRGTGARRGRGRSLRARPDRARSVWAAARSVAELRAAGELARLGVDANLFALFDEEGHADFQARL